MNIYIDQTLNTNVTDARSILRKIKAGQKKPDGIFGSFMTRPVSHVAAYISMLLNLSPNAVTVISFIMCAAASSLLVFERSYPFLLAAAALWWLGAILDAADGDLARFLNAGTKFGGWLDSLLDRFKEFIIFAVLGYFAWTDYSNVIYLYLGALSVFSNTMSGYITDTKKLFIEGKREPALQISKKYMFGMVDTRDFFVILSLVTANLRIALWVYGTFFMVLLGGQILVFTKKYWKA